VVRTMTLQDAPDTHHQALCTRRFIPVSEAVRLLGMSATTIRRKIEAGELEAERVQRPQGTAFLVKAPGDDHHAPMTRHGRPRSPQERPRTQRL